MRKVLVTGGAGFIGSNLCEALLQRGDQVVCLDNFSTGKIENILPLIEQYKDTFKLIVGDIRNMEDCQRAVADVDYVLHEAAIGSVPRSIKDPVTTNAVNIDGFLNMLIAARDAHVKRFIFAASSSTYGDSVSLPKAEEKTQILPAIRWEEKQARRKSLLTERWQKASMFPPLWDFSLQGLKLYPFWCIIEMYSSWYKL